MGKREKRSITIVTIGDPRERQNYKKRGEREREEENKREHAKGKEKNVFRTLSSMT